MQLCKLDANEVKSPILLSVLVPHRLPYSPQTSPGGSLCAVDVHPGKDFSILGRVWEGEGTRVFSLSGMTFYCAIVGDEQYDRVCCYWLE